MRVRPLRNFVLARVVGSEHTTKGGIVIPDTAHARPNRAVVLAVGSSVQGLEVGDRVVFHAYKIERVLSDSLMADAPGTPFAREGDRFVISAEHVLAVETEGCWVQADVDFAVAVLRDSLTKEAPRNIDAQDALNLITDIVGAS